MKKLILFGLLLVFFTSCKKQYNCSCNTTAIFPTSFGQGNYKSTNKPISEKMTKKQAGAVCDHEAENINDTYQNYWVSEGGSLSNTSFVTRCTLE